MTDESWIVLSDTVLNKERIVIIERDETEAGRVWVTLEGVIDRRYFDGSDAITLWRMFDKEAGWK